MSHLGTTVHNFDRALELHGDSELATGRTTPQYANMVGPFGGITAATLLRAIDRHPNVLGDPISLTTNFLGPVVEGAFDIAVRAVRTNRATQHWYAELTQDGIVATTATAVFGMRHTTWSDTEISFPAVPGWEDVAVQQFPESFAWPQNYEIRFVSGGLHDIDGTSNDDSVTIQWIRDHPRRPVDFASLTAMSDSFYPRVFRRVGTPLPAGTVSLTTYFHADGAALAAQDAEPILGVARAQHFGLGYFDQTAQLWGTNRRLLATSHQVVYFKS